MNQNLRRFYVSVMDVAPFAGLTDQSVFGVILENNPDATMWLDKIEDRIYVECQNKPRDIVVLGIVWREAQ